MSIYQHVTQFAGLPVRDWQPGEPLGDLARTAYRLGLGYQQTDSGTRWADLLGALLAEPDSAKLRALIAGPWDREGYVLTNSAPVVEALAAARDRLPDLRALFIGDIVSEESEISWIEQSDLSPLLLAYPNLEHLQIRGAGGNGASLLSFGTPRHAHLTTLIVESGGLPTSVVRETVAGDLPALEHLELWLGEVQYGWDGTVDDLAPILSGEHFPRLRYLGLRDSAIADQIAAAVAVAPILERIEVLDLSLGTLSDEGALALYKSPAVRRLRRLDIHRHYCSEAMVAELQGLGIEVDASERQEPDIDGDEQRRYVAVGE